MMSSKSPVKQPKVEFQSHHQMQSVLIKQCAKCSIGNVKRRQQDEERPSICSNTKKTKVVNPMKHVYFVSYSHNQGFGMIEISSDKPIKTYENVLAFRETIKEKNGFDVVILNWKKLNKKNTFLPWGRINRMRRNE